jgi:hypothetical protein
MNSHVLQPLQIFKQTMDGAISDARSATKKSLLKMTFGAHLAIINLSFQYQGEISKNHTFTYIQYLQNTT